MTDLDVVIRPHPKLEELIAVLERLRAPGGCAWDRAQTHESLVQYLVEETYELVDAIEAGDDKELVEELGDVLYQVVFHSDIAAEQGRFTLEDVAAHMTAKMVGRHPHVFGDLVAETPDAVMLHWDGLKAEEKPARASVLDGIPQAMPALALADKLLGRAAKVGRRASAGGRGGQRGRARRAAAQHRRRGPGCGARQRARAARRPARAATRDPRGRGRERLEPAQATRLPAASRRDGAWVKRSRPTARPRTSRGGCRSPTNQPGTLSSIASRPSGSPEPAALRSHIRSRSGGCCALRSPYLMPPNRSFGLPWTSKCVGTASATTKYGFAAKHPPDLVEAGDARLVGRLAQRIRRSRSRSTRWRS